MPERPDIDVYIEALAERFIGEHLCGIRLGNPFFLRTAVPDYTSVFGLRILGFRRLGKRVVFALEKDLFLVIHLMVAGRFQLKDKPNADLPKKRGLCALDFGDSTLVITEAGTKKRASLHVICGEAHLQEHDRGGVEIDMLDEKSFAARLREKNHTMKRAFTDPRILSGIGNAYSDEILHRAQVSPIALSQKVDDETYARLYAATVQILDEWTHRLRTERGDSFPKKVTAFRPEMAVHGKYGKPCPVCNDPIQKIAYAKNETNYCATCQTGGRLLKDRGLSRLLKKDWPRSLEELETQKERHRG